MRLPPVLRRLAPALAVAGLLVTMSGATGQEPPALPPPPPAEGSIRIAQFNAALARDGAGVLVHDLGRDDPQVANVVEIILHVRPDVLVLNELDADPQGRALGLFRDRLAAGRADLDGIDYEHVFQGRQNVGVFSGLDLDGDGRAAGPGDAWGYGRFPGQYAMAVLSRLPFDPDGVRTFTDLRWASVPDARRPTTPDGNPFHDDTVWQRLRLSSKSHWVIPLSLPGGGRLDLLAAHPTPPVFDGPEDRNGRRNADEIRLLEALISGASWPVDDAGRAGGLEPGRPFVIAGDLNADPNDGDGIRDAIAALLTHPRVSDPRPESTGGAEAGMREARGKRGDPARHTADWPETPGKPGNLRVDYVLPSTGLATTASGVFWPPRNHPLHRLVTRRNGRLASSDHRLVWIDIAP